MVPSSLCHLDGTSLLDTEGPASGLGVVAETEVGVGRAVLALPIWKLISGPLSPVRVRQGPAGARTVEHFSNPYNTVGSVGATVMVMCV